jgi:hypothetical protein
VSSAPAVGGRGHRHSTLSELVARCHCQRQNRGDWPVETKIIAARMSVAASVGACAGSGDVCA